MARKKRVKLRAKKRTNSKNLKFKAFLSEPKTKLAVRNIILFLVLSLVSYVASLLVASDLLVNLFSVMAMSFAFISVGFGIVFLILLILKLFRK